MFLTFLVPTPPAPVEHDLSNGILDTIEASSWRLSGNPAAPSIVSWSRHRSISGRLRPSSVGPSASVTVALTQSAEAPGLGHRGNRVDAAGGEEELDQPVAARAL